MGPTAVRLIWLALRGAEKLLDSNSKVNQPYTDIRTPEQKAADYAGINKINQSELYIDPQTCLMWVKYGNIAGKELTWSNAMNYVKSLSLGGYNDWRLPTKEEFEIFLKIGVNDHLMCLKINGFSDIQSDGYYWSSASCADIAGYAWMAHIDQQQSFVTGRDKNCCNYIWPVRSVR